MTDTRPRAGDRDALFARLTEAERVKYLRAACDGALLEPRRWPLLEARARTAVSQAERESDIAPRFYADAAIDALLPLLTEDEKRDLVFERFLLDAEPEDIVAKGFARLIPHGLTLAEMRWQDEAEERARVKRLGAVLAPIWRDHPDWTVGEAWEVLMAMLEPILRDDPEMTIEAAWERLMEMLAPYMKGHPEMTVGEAWATRVAVMQIIASVRRVQAARRQHPDDDAAAAEALIATMTDEDRADAALAWAEDQIASARDDDEPPERAG